MPRTQIACPNCRQPAVAEIEQLFDVGADPQAKQRLLSGQSNVVQCPSCGYAGMLATPVVYHDPEKELLLTFSPPEMGMKLEEQERILGPLIKKAVDSLPNEKRKAYLFRPQSMFTFQGLVERILEADGITKEMIQAQQKKLQLIQRLLKVTADDVLAEIVKQEGSLMDAEFFALLGRVAEASMMGGDRNAAQSLVALQQKLLPLTEYGRDVQAQSEEVQAAIKSLQDLGQNLSRESLLDLLVQASSDIRVEALTSMARPAMDYAFFQLLSEKIAKASGAEKDKLTALCERLLLLTREIDLQIEARADQSRQLLEAILAEPDIEAAMQQAIQAQAVDDFFMRALSEAQQAARQAADLDRLGKLGKVSKVLEEASTPPPELEFVQQLLDTEDEAAMKARLDANRDKITPEFMEMMAALLSQPQAANDPELSQRLQQLYGMAVRVSMENSMK
ncbi:MAG: CpXC domain-containing protein [Chloroflexota bacterium]